MQETEKSIPVLIESTTHKDYTDCAFMAFKVARHWCGADQSWIAAALVTVTKYTGHASPRAENPGSL